MMKSSILLSCIKTPLSIVGWALTSLIFTLLCIPLTFLPESIRFQNRLYFFLTTVWSELLMIYSFIAFKKTGEEHFPVYPNQPAVIVANHSSAMDIFLLETLVGTYPHMWLSKYEYGRIPLFSILLRRMHVLVNRRDGSQAARALVTVYQRLQGVASHLLVFPEGTRSSDGALQPFHEGFAVLAKKLNRPVIPVAIVGLHQIFPKGKLLIDYRATVPEVIIGKPITIEPDESVQDFTRRVHAWFETQLNTHTH